MRKKNTRFARNILQSFKPEKVEKGSISLLEKITDVATITSAFGIVIAIVQMCSQNKQFNDSFDLSNKQFQYQLKQDLLQDKADSIKDYRDSVKLQLAINEFAENKKNQETEAKRNESQFQKNIQTYQDLVRTNKQSNEYVVNSQKPFLILDIPSAYLKNDTAIFEVKFKNIGVRRALLTKREMKLYNKTGEKLFSIEQKFDNVSIGNDESYSTIKSSPLLISSSKNKYIIFIIIDMYYIDEFTKKPIHQEFYRQTADLKSGKIDNTYQCDFEFIELLKKMIVLENELKK